MELELQADPDTVGRLARLKALSAVREGHTRTQAVRTVWHDTPEHTLLQEGLTVAEQRGAWRLERVVPGSGTWLPGQPPPVLQQAEERESLVAALATRLPSPLAPLAAFEGRRRSGLYRLAAGTVTVCTERGVLRSVTTEQPVARIVLSGEDQAVLSAAPLIAAALDVRVPRAGLAAEAIALATGGAASPRHLGAPRLPDPDMSVPEGLAHILGHLTDVMLHHAPRAGTPDRAGPGGEDSEVARMEAVHQMRVAVRRALSAVSIFRRALPDGTLDLLRQGLKALGTRLSHTRDWDVFVAETAPQVAKALPPDERLDRLIAAAVRRRRDYRRDLADYLASPDFRVLGIELACFAASHAWHTAEPAAPDAPDQPMPPAEPPPAEKLSVRDFAPVVLQHRWKKLLAAGKRIDELDIPALHDVRLRAKRARYAAEMFMAPHQGKAALRFIRRLAELQERLGVLNDGAVAAHLLQELGGPSGRHGYAVGLVTGFAASRALMIRPRIVRAFEKFRRQGPYWT